MRRGSLGLSGPHYPTTQKGAGPLLWHCYSKRVGGVLHWVQSGQRGGRLHSAATCATVCARGATVWDRDSANAPKTRASDGRSQAAEGDIQLPRCKFWRIAGLHDQK